jgi:hypothetical protein
MKIHGIQGGELPACCKFNYRGVEISASTIFAPPNSINVTDSRQGEAVLLYEATSIEDAIEWINNNAYQTA